MDHKRFNFVILAAAALLLSCRTPPAWQQFHGDGPNRGFVPVSSARSFVPKWSKPTSVGPVSYSSPVVGPDGTIYVGTLDGKLVAVSPDGAIKWVFDCALKYENPIIVSSAAVDTDGNIYVIANHRVPGGNLPAPYDRIPVYRSALLQLRQDGSLGWDFIFSSPRYPLWGYTTASPKVWKSAHGVNIFVPLFGDLYIISGEKEVLRKEELHCSGDVVGGFTGSDFCSLASPRSLTQGPVYFAQWQDPTTYNLPECGRERWLEPTVAILESDARGPLTQPIVVAASNSCALNAYRWDSESRTLTRLWSRSGYNFTSPVISSGGEIIVGDDDGRLFSYDLSNGQKLWEHNAHEPFLGTPAYYAGVRVFAASRQRLDVLENGNLLHSTKLSGATGASVALTSDRAFVSTREGLFSYSLDLTSHVSHPMAGGMSSPAIASDGTVYATDASGQLWAFRSP